MKTQTVFMIQNIYEPHFLNYDNDMHEDNNKIKFLPLPFWIYLIWRDNIDNKLYYLCHFFRHVSVSGPWSVQTFFQIVWGSAQRSESHEVYMNILIFVCIFSWRVFNTYSTYDCIRLETTMRFREKSHDK